MFVRSCLDNQNYCTILVSYQTFNWLLKNQWLIDCLIILTFQKIGDRRYCQYVFPACLIFDMLWSSAWLMKNERMTRWIVLKCLCCKSLTYFHNAMDLCNLRKHSEIPTFECLQIRYSMVLIAMTLLTKAKQQRTSYYLDLEV